MRSNAVALSTDGHLISSGKIRVGLIAFKNYAFVRRPLNPKCRVIPTNAPRMIWDVELGHLIEDLGVVFQSLKSMGKAFRNVQRLAVVSRQYHCEMLLERRGSGTKVYDGVENRTASAAYELHFFMRGSLKMHSPERPFNAIKRNVALYEAGLQSVQFEFSLTKGTSKKSAVINTLFQFND